MPVVNGLFLAAAQIRVDSLEGGGSFVLLLFRGVFRKAGVEERASRSFAKRDRQIEHLAPCTIV
jgi:hypothetical protein